MVESEPALRLRVACIQSDCVERCGTDISLVPRPRGETALFAHAQEFRLFHGYFTVYFTTNDGQKPVL